MHILTYSLNHYAVKSLYTITVFYAQKNSYINEIPRKNFEYKKAADNNR